MFLTNEIVFVLIVAGCVGGAWYNHMTDAVTTLACGIAALEWQ